jgi:pyrroline-5-carboxylate reductase
MPATLAFIGGGNMGGAIIRGAIDRGLLPAVEILVADIDPGRREELSALGCAVTADAREALGAEHLMLAVKPQIFPKVVEVTGALDHPAVVMSIMAGLSSASIRAALGPYARVIRVMPNTPCQVGAGMSAIALGEGAAEGDDRLAWELFGALGHVVSVEEDQMHAVTAVSGSGPAYVFLLEECMEVAAIDLGLPPQVARHLARQTVLGAGALLRGSNEPASALREVVTSPGGTTAAAIDVFERHGLHRVVAEAITAARDRGIELGG